MATTIYPTQTRAVDSYASYNSNVVNRLTRIMSLEHQDVIMTPPYLDITWDSTSASDVVLTSGKCLKDDVLIEVSSDFDIDMSDSDFYVDITGGVWNEAGYYYVVLEYVYVKAKPAPVASIQILKPSQRSLLTAQYLFLKAVHVSFSGAVFEIDATYDYDPENTDVYRKYPYSYIMMLSTLPVFDPTLHKGLIIIVGNNFYVGVTDRWIKFRVEQDEIHIVTAADVSTGIVDVGFDYFVGQDELEVYLNGVLLRKNEIIGVTEYGDYDELTDSSIQFNSDVIEEDSILRFRVA